MLMTWHGKHGKQRADPLLESLHQLLTCCGGGEACPRAISRLPVRSYQLPAWELFEMRSLRLDRPADAATSTSMMSASAASAAGAAALPPYAVTAVSVGEGFEKLLWTASVDGRVRSWRAPLTAPPPTEAEAPARAAPSSEEVPVPVL